MKYERIKNKLYISEAMYSIIDPVWHDKTVPETKKCLTFYNVGQAGVLPNIVAFMALDNGSCCVKRDGRFFDTWWGFKIYIIYKETVNGTSLLFYRSLFPSLSIGCRKHKHNLIESFLQKGWGIERISTDWLTHDLFVSP